MTGLQKPSMWKLCSNESRRKPARRWTDCIEDNLLEQQTCQSIERLHTVYVETAVSYQEKVEPEDGQIALKMTLEKHPHTHTHTHTFLTVIFPGEPG